jgi:hypothetical protein
VLVDGFCDILRQDYGNMPGGEVWRVGLVGALEDAETFFVAGHICPAIEGAARTMPTWPLVAERLPAFCGWAMFERPLGFGEYGIDAILWAPVSYEDGSPDALMVHLFSREVTAHSALRGMISLSGLLHWPLGGSVSEYIDGQNRNAGAYVAAFFSFVHQRILVSRAQPVLNRQKRRRLRERLQHEPLVRVIELRRRDYADRGADESEPAEWSCRWLVRGHWHRYHTRGGLEPRWVNPYVKGPDDRPFKAPRATVYEVVR